MMDSVSLQTAVRDSSLDTATANTLTALYHPHGSFRDAISSSLPTFVPSASTLVAAHIPLPDASSLQFMHELISAAQATATSNFYDSLIAGPFSESANGEFTDVGVWLGRGDYRIGQENAILAALGLEECTRSANARVCLSWSNSYRNGRLIWSGA
ncbi:hypothetical protein JVU11DRAFT_2486 [Chiua virens]|nr:hypothetical protein JVU11DRAFT_2486 [Chiua virens]